jgi:hypothetical protein
MSAIQIFFYRVGNEQDEFDEDETENVGPSTNLSNIVRQSVEQHANDMEVDEPEQQPRGNTVDADGWTTIVSKKKK